MIVLCHECENECKQVVNEEANRMGFLEYFCCECGERFLTPKIIGEFKNSQS